MEDFFAKIIKQQREAAEQETPELADARRRYSVGTFVVPEQNGQIETVVEIPKINGEGIVIKTGAGLVPINDLRPATEKEADLLKSGSSRFIK